MATKILLFTHDTDLEKSFLSALPQEQFSITRAENLKDVVEIAMEQSPQFCIFDEKKTHGEWVDISESMNEIIDIRHIEKLLIARKEITPGLVSLAVQAGISEIIPRNIDPLMLLLKMDSLLLRHERCKVMIQSQQDTAAKRVGYSVEHYVGQPLTAVMGAVQLIDLMKSEGKRLDDPEIDELIKIVLRSSEELSKIIHQFASLTSFSIQKHIVNHDLIDLGHLDEEDDQELDNFEMF